MEDEVQRTLRDIRTILEEEREILLRGELLRLDGIADRKRALEERCAAISDAKLPELRELREKAAHNHDLLHAALDGLRSVSDRVTALRRARSCLETYDRVGRKRRLEPEQRHEMEKRA